MVLLINQLAIPVFQDVANAFAARGYEVTVFTGQVEDNPTPLHESIRIVKAARYHRSSIMHRLSSWLLFSAQAFLYLLFVRRVTHILVVTNPPIAPAIVSFMARLKGIEYSVLVYDLYPEALQQAGFSTDQSLIFRSWKVVNPWVFNRARCVITLSQSMKQAVSRYIVNNERVHVIYNWADTRYIKPIPKDENNFLRAHGITSQLVVIYGGNMGLTHDLESLLTAAMQLKGNPDIGFILIGDGAKRSRLVQMKEAMNLSNVTFLPYQSMADFPLAMGAADIGVVTLGKGAEGISVPSKTYVSLASGSCILAIAPKSSELGRLVSEYDCGFIAEPGHSQEIVEFLMSMLQNPDRLAVYKARSREASLNFDSGNAYQYVELVGIKE